MHQTLQRLASAVRSRTELAARPGSFAAQEVILDRSDLYAGVVLSGSTALDVLAQGIAAAGDGPVELTAFNAAFESATLLRT